MRPLWLVLLISAGCAFDPPDGAVDPEADPTTDPQAPAAGACDPSDPTLRLCVDFHAPLADGSSNRARIQATAVSAMDRGGDPAALLTSASTMHVGEATALDIADRLTLDLWMRPDGTPAAGTRYWLLDNNMQYGASFTDLRTVRCVLGNRTVDSDRLPDDGQFHHVACVFDPAQAPARLKVYVDGAVARCLDVTGPIPTTGASGLAIGANLAGTDATPSYAEPFLGGLDDVRVWARSDLDICKLAGRTGCSTACP